VTGQTFAPGSRRPPIPAPEIIAGVIAVVVLVIVASAGMAGGRSTPTGGARTAAPPGSTTPAAATVEPVVDPQVVALLGEVNLRLADTAAALGREVGRSTLQIRNVRDLVVQVSTNVAIGADQVINLGGALGDEEPGGRLAALYGRISSEADQTLDNALTHDVAYKAGGLALIELIGQLPPLQEALEALLVASPSPSPSASSPAPSASASSAPPAASPSPPASSEPPPSASPSGDLPSGSPSPFVPGGPEPPRAPDEQIENGGFEDRADVSWALLRAPGANAALTLDPELSATGSLSARVDIITGSDAYAGIALRQVGLQLEIGRNYTVMFNIRSTEPRPIRVKVLPAFGGSYQVRDIDATPVWTPVLFSFFATDTDPNAVLEIQLGRSTATTWIDTVSFRPTPAF
jgi:hypothetical protein